MNLDKMRNSRFYRNKLSTFACGPVKSSQVIDACENEDEDKNPSPTQPAIAQNPLIARVHKRAKKELWIKKDCMTSSEKYKHRSIIKKVSDNDKNFTETLIDFNVQESQEGVKVALLFDDE